MNPRIIVIKGETEDGNYVYFKEDNSAIVSTIEAVPLEDIRQMIEELLTIMPDITPQKHIVRMMQNLVKQQFKQLLEKEGE